MPLVDSPHPIEANVVTFNSLMSHLAASELWQQSVQQLKEMMKLVQAGEKPLNVEGVFKIVFFYSRLSYYTYMYAYGKTHENARKETKLRV